MCFIIIIGTILKAEMDILNGMEHVPTYEDKNGDCMLITDVSWK